MGKLKWLDAYHKEFDDKPDMSEIGWRGLFIEQVIRKGLGYPSKLVRNEENDADIRILTPDGISHLVFETKKSDADLDKEATSTQAQGYLNGGESLFVLASPSRLRVFTPKGTLVGDIALTEKTIEGNATFWQLSYEYMSQRKHLDTFREGEFDYCFIPVNTYDGFGKFVSALRLCGDLLLRHLGKAWEGHKKQYAVYLQKQQELEEKRRKIESLPITGQELKERLTSVEREARKLATQYSVTVETERSFSAFAQIQPYSRDVAEKELLKIYLTDITYQALNRVLFVRIAEDKGLLKRKISNGGIGVWRNFVTFLKDKYQDLLQLAFQDAANIYEHFFEQGIFDWYIKSDSNLHEALEDILYLLNAFDLSKVDRDILGDLYQQYLKPETRKELGEFYTPREVIDYILRHIGWTGAGTIIDPACGSGGFLVRAASTLLKDMEQRGLGERARFAALDRVVGLDINPFATHIAEMNLLFLILDIYLKAKSEAQKTGEDFSLQRLPIFTIDSLLGTILENSWSFATATEIEKAFKARDRFGEYDYLVMNPPYVRNERLPEEPRGQYRTIFRDVSAMNADIFTYFLKKAMDWVKEGGRIGVIVSLGLADARANEKLRKFLSGYTIERVVSLEWADVFVANVNPILLFIKKTLPDKGHKIALVQGIKSLKELDEDKGNITYVLQDRWLGLAPDSSWRVEVEEADLTLLEKMKQVPARLTGEYGMTLRGTGQGRELISYDSSKLGNPYPLLDGREIKAWSIEWQGRYIDYQPKLISDPKTLDFFKAPKVVVRRISLTTQATVDDGSKNSYLARDTVMVVRSTVKELNDYPYVIAAAMNSLPARYYAFLMLSGGVMEGSHRSTFYPRVIGCLPVPEA
ncbi:MAG: N-6 DNA methylase, partial [Chloroflexota bacterium]